MTILIKFSFKKDLHIQLFVENEAHLNQHKMFFLIHSAYIR